MDNETVSGPSGAKGRSARTAAANTRKKNIAAEPEPSTSAGTGAAEVKKRARKDTAEKATKQKDVAAEPEPSTSASTGAAEVKKRAREDTAEKATKQKDAKPSKPPQKTTLEMVCEAIAAVGEGTKGASSEAIKKYLQNEQGTEIQNYRISRAIVKGMETGVLLRAKPIKGTLLSRRFMLVEKEKVKTKGKKDAPKKVEKQISKEGDIIKRPPKAAKRTLAETFVKGLSNTSTPKPLVKSEAVKDSKIPKGGGKALESDLDDWKESSDTEIVVKPKNRKSTKAYSSDTELDFTRILKEKNKNKTRTTKAKSSQMEIQAKPPKSKGTVKMSNTDQKLQKEKTTKSKKN